MTSAGNRTKPEGTKILVCAWHPFTLWRTPEEMAAAVRQKFPAAHTVHLPTYDRLADELPETDIFVGYSIRPEQFPLARRLKWIHSTAAGVAQLTYAALRESGVAVTNASGVHSIPIAEHVLGLLLGMSRRFADAQRFQEQAHWAQQEVWDITPRLHEVRGRTALLIGLGAVGKEVARLARAAGMRIHAVTRSGRGDSTLVEKIHPAGELERALAAADYVVLAAPETAETHHLMGARQFAAMKPDAYFINVARGSLVDETALAEALGSRKIAGAAIDVAETEPLPAESRLWRTKNLFITPHLAAASEQLWERQTALLIENLERWFDGRELLNRVDLQRGY